MTSLAALGLAATIALSSSPVLAQISFVAPPPTFATGDSPNSITVGDLDGDGDLDLATANSNSDDVSVLKNNGNGTFATVQNFAAGNAPTSVNLGDLDGDGDLDLATANGYSNNVSVLKNNGNATFAAPQNFATGDPPNFITVGDLDGDGDLDIATANRNTYTYYDAGTVSVLKNNGDGTFVTAQTFYDRYGFPFTSITVGDLDGDGDLDLATASSNRSARYDSGYGSVSVFKNNGNGTFAIAQNFTVADRPISITVGDLDGDGDLDIATANGSTDSKPSTGSVLRNNGNGTFANIQYLAGGGSSVTVGDLDGDSDLDLATANSSSDTVSVLKNNGDGTYATVQSFPVAYGFESITAGDLDGDGDLDLATAKRYPAAVSILKNNGNGTFTTRQTFVVSDFPSSITIGDLDGDGDLDIATANSGGYPNYTSTVSVLKNNGNGTFATAQNFAVGDYPRSITVGDLDRDGDLDLATANFYGVSVLKNNGNGTFAAPQNLVVPRYAFSITVGDLDGDGDLDLATANSTGYPNYISAVSVLKNNGNGTFATAQNFTVGDYPRSITIGDLDGDGDLDLATANRGSYPDYIGTVSVLKNNGNGTFATPQNFVIGGGPTSITVGDLDGDGDLDLATANSDTVSVLKNNGNGTFATAQTFDTVDSPRSITIGDLDRDSDLDLAITNRGSYPEYVSTVSVLQNSTPTLQLSLSPSRVNPVPLAGQSVLGTIYIFTSGKDSDFKRVQFYLDDPDRSGEPIRLERSAPFDFAGGTNMDPTITQANPFDTRTLTDGQHTITATFARTDGTFRTITSTFTVSN